MLDRLIEFAKGRVRVRIALSVPTLFISALHREGIAYSVLKRVDDSTLELETRPANVQGICALATRYGGKVVEQQYIGLLYTLAPLRGHIGLLTGIAVGVLIFFILYGFIWDIKITGCENRVSESEVREQFESLGVGIGTPRKDLDFSAVENAFLTGNNEVIWASLNLKFNTLYIELCERDILMPQTVDIGKPCDIIAARDGQIVELRVAVGVPKVTEGSAVRAGELLVSHAYTGKHEENITVHSEATVLAKTKRTLQVICPISSQKHIPTGKSKSFYTFRAFNFEIPLYFNQKISYNNYDKTERESVAHIGSLSLPFGLQKETFYEVNISEQHEDIKTVKAAALRELELREKRELSATKINARKVRETEKNGQYILTAEYECIENIAQKTGVK